MTPAAVLASTNVKAPLSLRDLNLMLCALYAYRNDSQMGRNEEADELATRIQFLYDDADREHQRVKVVRTTTV